MLVPEAQYPHDCLIAPLTVVRRERLLAVPGQVLVSPGSSVGMGDVVAATEESGPVHVLDGAQALGVAPQRVPTLLQVAEGERVQAGQVLARRGGLWRRTLLAPATGTLALVDERGLLLIRETARRQQLQALLRGEVMGVMPGRGVVIEAQGALLQGVWGNGQENFGLLRVLVPQPDVSVTPSLINAGVRSTILVAGATIDRTGLENARAAQAHGVIAGSMDATLQPLARQMPFPILLTEGFGQRPISAPAFRLLQSLDGRDGALMALYLSRHGRRRPELFVPLPSAAIALFPPGPLAAGDRVRLLGAPHQGQLGTVLESEGERLTLPNEVSATGCEVRLDSGARVQVPYTNVERLLP